MTWFLSPLPFFSTMRANRKAHIVNHLRRPAPLGNGRFRPPMSTFGHRLGHDSNHYFPRAFTRGRPHRELVVCRRRSLSLKISLISAAGRISIVPHFNLTPGDWEMS
jgi:hypothetical protein